jgi:hypothetical protein
MADTSTEARLVKDCCFAVYFIAGMSRCLQIRRARPYRQGAMQGVFQQDIHIL